MNKDAQLLVDAEDSEAPACIWRVAFEYENNEGHALNETLDVSSFDDGEKAIKKAKGYINEISEEMGMKPDSFKLQGLRLLAKSEIN
jgi:hypothetical protein